MKKILQILAVLSSVAILGLSPVVVQAQSGNGVIEVEDDASQAAAAATNPTPAAPNTGIAPTENKVLQNAAVFIGGSLLGAGLGIGVLTIRKKSSE